MFALNVRSQQLQSIQISIDFFFLRLTRQGLAGHPLQPFSCLNIQAEEALFAVRGPVQGAVGDEVVNSMRIKPAACTTTYTHDI